MGILTFHYVDDEIINKELTGYWFDYSHLINKTQAINQIGENETLSILPIHNNEIVYESLFKNANNSNIESIYWMAYLNLPRSKIMDEVLFSYITDYDPFQVKRLDLFFKDLMVHIIYMIYREKYQLTDSLEYSEHMVNKINAYLQQDKFPSVKMTDIILENRTYMGYIYDDDFEEYTLYSIADGSMSIFLTMSIIESIYLILRYRESKMLLNLVRQLFGRLSQVIFDNYLQLWGMHTLYGKNPTTHTFFYKAKLLKVLALCNHLDPNLSIGHEFIRQFTMLDETSKQFFTLMPQYFVKANEKLQKFQYYSSVNAISVIRNIDTCFEILSLNHQSDFSFINYGFNYINHDNFNKFKYSAYFAFNHTYAPFMSTIVPLDTNSEIFYTSHHTNKSICDGYYNSVLGLHTYTMLFLKDITTYVIFSWHTIDETSSYIQLPSSESKSSSSSTTTTITTTTTTTTVAKTEKETLSYEIIVFCNNITYSIKSSHPMEIVQSSPYYGYIRIMKPQNNVSYTFAIRNCNTKDREANQLDRIPIIKRYKSFDENLTKLIPATLKITDFVHVTYNKSKFIIYTANDKQFYDSTLDSIVYKGKQYKIIQKSNRTYVQLDDDDNDD